MNEQDFTKLAKEEVAKYANEHVDKTDNIKPLTADDIYMVWCVKVLQNNKGLFATPLPDGMYYELTYNGNKKELYIDAYKKFENRCVNL